MPDQTVGDEISTRIRFTGEYAEGVEITIGAVVRDYGEKWAVVDEYGDPDHDGPEARYEIYTSVTRDQCQRGGDVINTHTDYSSEWADERPGPLTQEWLEREVVAYIAEEVLTALRVERLSYAERVGEVTRRLVGAGLVTRQDAARLLGVSRPTLRRWMVPPGVDGVEARLPPVSVATSGRGSG